MLGVFSISNNDFESWMWWRRWNENWIQGTNSFAENMLHRLSIIERSKNIFPTWAGYCDSFQEVVGMFLEMIHYPNYVKEISQKKTKGHSIISRSTTTKEETSIVNDHGDRKSPIPGLNSPSQLAYIIYING